jgi:hypothetical protein
MCDVVGVSNAVVKNRVMEPLHLLLATNLATNMLVMST